MMDLHTHTFRCKHAQGDIPDLAKQAERKGYSVLGISDHVPFPDDHNIEIRMSIQELEDYKRKFHKTKAEHPGLEMLLGMECEYLPQYINYYRDELIGERGINYLILAQHLFYCEGRLAYFWREEPGADKKILKAYTKAVAEGLETELFGFLAHPDLFGYFYLPWDKEAEACSRYILEAAQAYKVPLEINGNGFRKGIRDAGGIKRLQYPLEPFWELAAEYDVSVLVNSDAHKPSELAPPEEGFRLARKYQLKMADRSDIRVYFAG